MEAPLLVITPGPPCRRIGASKHLVRTLLGLAGVGYKQVRAAWRAWLLSFSGWCTFSPLWGFRYASSHCALPHGWPGSGSCQCACACRWHGTSHCQGRYHFHYVYPGHFVPDWRLQRGPTISTHICRWQLHEVFPADFPSPCHLSCRLWSFLGRM